MAERAAFLIELCTLRRIWWIIEQPCSTLLFHYPAIRKRLTSRPRLNICGHKPRRKFVWLGFWEHKLYKPTVLVGIAPFMLQLNSTKKRKSSAPLHWSHGNLRTSGDRAGTYRVQGSKTDKADLKFTQIYPAAFCRAMADVFLTFSKTSFQRHN